MLPERFATLPADALAGAAGRLLEEGFCIVREAMPREEIVALSDRLDGRFASTPFCVGPFHGERTKRFHRLLARARESADLVMHAEIMAMVNLALGQWCDFPEINLTQGVEIHPGAPAQIPHSDQSMWPVPKGEMELCINIFWPLSEFTAQNGATRVWPGTHNGPWDGNDPSDDPLVCEMLPGDALLVLGSTRHAAGANLSTRPRRAVIVSYCLGWLKAYENQSLAYSADFARTLDPELAALLGYRWHRPNLGTYDGQCPSILLAEDTPDHLATKDALSREHETLVWRFANQQIGSKGVAQ